MVKLATYFGSPIQSKYPKLLENSDSIDSGNFLSRWCSASCQCITTLGTKDASVQLSAEAKNLIRSRISSITLPLPRETKQSHLDIQLCPNAKSLKHLLAPDNLPSFKKPHRHLFTFCTVLVSIDVVSDNEKQLSCYNRHRGRRLVLRLNPR